MRARNSALRVARPCTSNPFAVANVICFTLNPSPLCPTLRPRRGRLVQCFPRGGELGFRTQIVRHVERSVAIWLLRQDSELLFTGDAGTTEPSRPTRRKGIEWINTYRPLSWLLFDAQFSYSEARFTDADP